MKSGSAPPDGRLENIAPIQSSAGAIPSGLPQPPLSPNAAGKSHTGFLFLPFFFPSNKIFSFLQLPLN